MKDFFGKTREELQQWLARQPDDEPAVIGGGCLLEPVDGLFPGEEQLDGYWDDEIDRQFHYEVKGG